MYKVMVVAEGEVDRVFKFDTQEEAFAFGKGVEHGANLYGAGSCGAYMLSDLGEYGEEIDALIKKHLLDKEQE